MFWKILIYINKFAILSLVESFKDKKGTILFETANKSFSLPNTPKGHVRLSQLYKDSEFAGRTQKTTASTEHDQAMADYEAALAAMSDAEEVEKMAIK